MKRKSTSFLLCFLSLFFFFGCKKESALEKAYREKILLVGNSNEPKGLDPQLVSGVLEMNIIRSLFEGLCLEHPSQDRTSVPGVAYKWESLENGRIWIFYLHPNAKWSDGTPLVAEDFVFSYHRILSPNFGAVYSEMLYPLKNAKEYNKNEIGWILFGNQSSFNLSPEIIEKINFDGKDSEQKSFNKKGLKNLNLEELQLLEKNPQLFDWNEEISPKLSKSILKELIQYRKKGSPDLWEKAKVGVEALDKHTLKFTLRGPTAYLPELTKHLSWFPVPKHIILKYGKIDTPFTDWTKEGNHISNGPFKLKKWRFNHFIKVEKNPHYWDKNRVSLKGIKFYPISNSYTEARMFHDELLHLTYGLPPALIKWAKTNHLNELKQENYLGTRFVRFNTKVNPLNNPKVRKALALALDKKIYIESILKGGQNPAYSLVPPMQGYQPNGNLFFDPKEAKRLLREAGYPNGKNFPKLTFLTTDRETAKREAETIQEMWKKHLGISIRIEQKEWTSFLESQYQANYEISSGGWIGDYIDPTTFLELWTKTNGNNCTNWSNQKYEELLSKAQQTKNTKKRFSFLNQAEKILSEEVPIAPLYWYATNYLIHSDVKNWHPLLLKTQPYKFFSLERNSSKTK